MIVYKLVQLNFVIGQDLHVKLLTILQLAILSRILMHILCVNIKLMEDALTYMVEEDAKIRQLHVLHTILLINVLFPKKVNASIMLI